MTMSKVLLLLDHRGNRRLLNEVLSSRYEVVVAESDDDLDGAFDLGIVDGVALDRLWERIRGRKLREGAAFLPFLFVSSRQDVGMATRHLWKSIDDLILSPIEKVELQARVESLLQTRRLSREFYRALVQASSVAIVVVDAQGKVQQWNPAAECLFGWSQAEVLDRFPPVFPEVEPGEVPFFVKQALADACLINLEVRGRKKDGALVDIEVSAAPLRDANGVITHVVCLASDISDRKRAEEALRESETRNRVIAEMISDYAYIFRVTPAGELVGEWVTESFTKRFGYTKEEVDARGGWQSLVLPEDLEIARAHARKVAGGQADTCEMRWVTADGQIRWLRDYAKPVYDETGTRVVRIYGASQDVTERREAEEALALQLRVASIFLTVPDEGVFQEVLKVVIEVMRSPLGLFGYLDQTGNLLVSVDSQQAWDGQQTPVNTLVLPPERWGNSSWGRALREKRANYSNEVSADTPPGHVTVTRHVSVPILFRDEAIGIFAVANKESDYTERDVRILETIAAQVAPLLHARLQRARAEKEKEALQHQLVQAQKMDCIGRLAGGVAHDFNNMLSIILGYGEMILEQLRPGDPLREDVKQIVEAGKRSQALTRQLLAFSRKQTLEPEVLNVNQHLRDLEPMLKRLLGEDVDLRLVLAEGLAPVFIDAGQFDQTIMNLAVNAREAMPGGGRLTIETANVAIDELYARTHLEVTPGAYVMIAVSDSGHGMDESTLSHLFEPFFTTKEKGTGLGLATVYGIVKQSGGHIFAYSEPGKGSTFKIYLPQTQAVPPARETAPEREELIGRGRSVLVVEDEEALRGLLRATLARLGFQVFLAANGGEAVLLVEEEGLKPDLLLTDVIMPGMSGTTLVERLRRRLPALKVLFMSGYTDEAVVSHGVLPPGSPFIQKPFTLQAMAEKIRDALGGGQGPG